MERINIVKPGLFSLQVMADSRRGEFDCKNEVIVTNKVPVDFVFIGDSITHMWELNAYFGKTERLILNRGIGGDTTEYLLKRFEADVIQLKPDYCVINIGVNDSWALEPDPWTGKSLKTLETVESNAVINLTETIKLAKEKDQKLLICSVLPTNMPYIQKSKERNQYIIRLNNFLKQICTEQKIIYVDYHSHFTGQDGITLKDGLTMDGLHPHVFGYNIMADVLRKTLAENGIII